MAYAFASQADRKHFPAPASNPMTVRVQFWSYFKDLTGCPQTSEELPAAATLGDLLQRLHGRFPKLAEMQNSTLIAVGIEYQGRDYPLKDGDEVSLFPPVQGG